MSLVLYGLQMLLAYSRIGLTSDLNNKQNVLKSKYLNDLLIIPTICKGLSITGKCKVLSITGKCKVLSITGKRHQQRTTNYMMPTYSGSYVTLESIESEKDITLVGNIPIVYSLVSSANMYTSNSTFSGKSLINNTNNTGPSTEPCGIPLVTLCHFKNSASNYRPLSLTSIICKLKEKLIRKRIIQHMDKFDLFSIKQFGFMGGRSTTLQLLKVLYWSKYRALRYTTRHIMPF
jgi:hypothetical protein